MKTEKVCSLFGTRYREQPGCGCPVKTRALWDGIKLAWRSFRGA